MDERQIIHHSVRAGPAIGRGRADPKSQKTGGGDMYLREDGIPWRASTRSIGSLAMTIRIF